MNYIKSHILEVCVVLTLIFFIIIFQKPIQNVIYDNNPDHISSRSSNTFKRFFVYREVSYPQEYFAVTGWMWMLAGVSSLFFLLMGRSRSCVLILKALGFSFLALIFFVLFLEPKQFLILGVPIVTAYYLVLCFFQRKLFFQMLNFFVLFLTCEVVLIFQFLSLIHKLNSTYFLIVSSAILTLSVLIFKPDKFYAEKLFLDFNTINEKIINFISSNKWISVFTFAILISILWRFLLILYVPANSVDGMEYHLPRIAHWMQNGSMAVYETNNLRQVAFPFNASILKMWTMISSKQDYLCGFVQFVCYLLSGTLIFQISREILEYTRKISFWTTLLALSMAQPVLQSTSTGNDLVLAYFILASVYFSIIGFQKKSWLELIFASLALGLAIGTKMSALFFVIPYFLVLGCCIVSRRLRLNIVLRYAIYVIISFFLLGSYSYIQNRIVFGNISGTQSFIDYHRVSHPTFQTFISNLGKNIYSIMVNHAGWNVFSLQIAHVYQVVVWHIGEFIFNLFNIQLNIPGSYTAESSLNVFPNGPGSEFRLNSKKGFFNADEFFSHYGLCGSMVVFLLVIPFLKGFKKSTSSTSRQFLYGLRCVFFGYLFLLSYFKVWDHYLGRLMMPILLLGALVFGEILSRNNKKFDVLVKVLTVYSIITLMPLTFMNEDKSFKRYLRKRTKLFTEERNYDRIGWRFLKYPRSEAMIRNYYKLVPEGSSVGTLISFWEMEYPFFGEGLTRRIEAITLDNITTKSFDYLVVSKNLQSYHPELMDAIDKKYTQSSVLGMTFTSEAMYLYKRILKENKYREF